MKRKSTNKKTDVVYVAYLTGGRMYVGHTDNFKKRKWEHMNGKGSAVTRKYPPKYIKAMFSVPAVKGKAAEIRLTRQLIRKYGSNKVRGGYHEHAFNF